MCGIAGVWDPNGHDHLSAVRAMLRVVEHRGPDASGTYADGRMTLGHRRLSIIDLSDAADQPMQLAQRPHVITYNGEIYNYLELREELLQAGLRFSTASDTEVLVQAYAHWGRDCLYRLNGMFAFAIYDAERQELFCARDRLGVKPFLYSIRGNVFAFASEHKSIVAGGFANGEASSEALYEFIARGYTSSGRSFFAGIQSLRPGHALHVEANGRVRTWEWWRPDTSPLEGQTLEECRNTVGMLVADAVRLRLRSDVPVGAHLSGGLDSSAIVAAAALAGSRVATFTGAFTDDAASDERRFSRAVAAAYELPAHEVEIGVDALADSWDRLLWHLDEPTAGPGAFPQLLVCDLAASHGMKVILGGQGGDELFGGYLRHRVLFHRRVLAEADLSQRMKSGLDLLSLVLRELRRIRRTSTRVPDSALNVPFLESVNRDVREELRSSPLRAKTASELMLHDLRTYLPALLQVEDRTSMAASLESRTPLLDYRLVEFALRVPERIKLGGRLPKPLLRAAVSPWLPPAVAGRRDKRGFPTPLQHWRSRPALEALVERLCRVSAGASSVFSPHYLAGYRSFAPSELWTVMMINGWLERAGSTGASARVAA